MREILFRGKRKDNGEWVYGFAIFADNKAFILNNAKVEFVKGFNENRLNFVLIEVIPETVGQFTGLTDTIGKKIFEGDIIKNSINWKCRVEYAEASLYPFVAYPDFCSWNAEECEVIGNIHDNPELMKGGV